MKLLLTIILISFTLQYVHSNVCTVTCMTPTRTNVTMYCPQGLWSFYVCYTNMQFDSLCVSPGFTFNSSDPNITAWVLCR